jgi:hypothetical protein
METEENLSMMNRKITLFTTAFAGLMDSATGILLMLSPAFTMSLMGIEAVYQEDIFIRFVGGFVFGVGSSYLLGLMSVVRGCGWRELRVVWKMTAWVRLVILLFTSVAILSGSLSADWFGVPLTDGALACFQIFWIITGRFPGKD